MNDPVLNRLISLIQDEIGKQSHGLASRKSDNLNDVVWVQGQVAGLRASLDFLDQALREGEEREKDL